MQLFGQIPCKEFHIYPNESERLSTRDRTIADRPRAQTPSAHHQPRRKAPADADSAARQSDATTVRRGATPRGRVRMPSTQKLHRPHKATGEGTGRVLRGTKPRRPAPSKQGCRWRGPGAARPQARGLCGAAGDAPHIAQWSIKLAVRNSQFSTRLHKDKMDCGMIHSVRF